MLHDIARPARLPSSWVPSTLAVRRDFDDHALVIVFLIDADVDSPSIS